MIKLSSQPDILGHVIYPYVFWDDFMSQDLIKQTIDYCDAHGTGSSYIINEHGQEAEVLSVRNSKIQMHRFDEKTAFMFDKFLDIATHINNNFYNFDLLGFDHFQYTVYDQVGSHYDFHTDTIFGENIPLEMKLTRKLSFSLVLSDCDEYKGGDLELFVNGGDAVKVEQKKGRIIAFPSFMMHRVSPIIKGCRKSIVFWALGPKFR